MRSIIETLIICIVAVAPLLLVAYFTGQLTTDTGVVNADIIELVEDLNEDTYVDVRFHVGNYPASWDGMVLYKTEDYTLRIVYEPNEPKE